MACLVVSNADYDQFEVTNASECNCSDPSYWYTELCDCDYPETTATDLIQEALPLGLWYGLVLVLGVIGNTLVITVVVRYRKMRSFTNILLASLSTADLLIVLFCLPVQYSKYLSHSWIMGVFLCISFHYVELLTMICSLMTMTVISIQRYLAIAFPMQSISLRSKRRALRTVLLTWVLSAFLAIPILFGQGYPNRPTLSVTHWKRVANKSSRWWCLNAAPHWYLQMKHPSIATRFMRNPQAEVVAEAMFNCSFSINIVKSTFNLEYRLADFPLIDGSSDQQSRHHCCLSRGDNVEIEGNTKLHELEVNRTPKNVTVSWCWRRFSENYWEKFVVLYLGPFVTMAISYILLIRHLYFVGPACLNDDVFSNHQGNDLVDSCVEMSTCSQSIVGRKKSIRREQSKKVTKMLVTILLLFFICWTPTLVDEFLVAFDYLCHTSPTTTLKYMRMIFAIMKFSNSCINPLVYAFMSNSFRSTFMIACGPLFMKRNAKCHLGRKVPFHHESPASERSLQAKYDRDAEGRLQRLDHFRSESLGAC
ncbi:7 transmembrane receptor [Trichuris suis]|nr:7 transmembrane receptor [Trichuris suis]